jgi:hypothetical protein
MFSGRWSSGQTRFLRLPLSPQTADQNGERPDQLHAARQSCHNALLSLRAWQKEELHHGAERQGGRASCNAGKQRAREEGFSLESEAQSEYDEERNF